jgi:RNA polymerase sigma factor for flagellar operon FliA
MKSANMAIESQTKTERHKFIESHLKLVSQVVKRLGYFQSSEVDEEDLIGYGVIGLIEAIDKYEPSKGHNFQAFALPRIRGAIFDQMRSIDPLGRNSRKKVKTLVASINQLEQELQAIPSDQQIAAHMKITLKELREIQREASINTLSLDATVSDDSDESWVEQLSDHRSGPEEHCEAALLRANLEKAIDSLPEREKLVIGLYHYRKMTIKEVANVLKVSESRACQIHNRAVSFLRSKLINH